MRRARTPKLALLPTSYAAATRGQFIGLGFGRAIYLVCVSRHTEQRKGARCVGLVICTVHEFCSRKERTCLRRSRRSGLTAAHHSLRLPHPASPAPPFHPRCCIRVFYPRRTLLVGEVRYRRRKLTKTQVLGRRRVRIGETEQGGERKPWPPPRARWLS